MAHVNIHYADSIEQFMMDIKKDTYGDDANMVSLPGEEQPQYHYLVIVNNELFNIIHYLDTSYIKKYDMSMLKSFNNVVDIFNDTGYVQLETSSYYKRS